MVHARDGHPPIQWIHRIRLGQRRQQTRRLGHGFVIFRLRNGVGHNPRPHMEPRGIIPDDRRTDCDAQLTLAIESQVAMAPTIRPAGNRLEFVYDLERTDLRRPGDAPARETRSEGVEMRYRRPQTPWMVDTRC